MPLIKASKDTYRIHLPADGEWVDVKTTLGRDDERYVLRRVLSSARVSLAGEVGDLDAGAALDAAEFATLEVAIKKWSFRDPLTPATLRQLDDASLQVIKEELNRLYPAPLSEDEKND